METSDIRTLLLDLSCMTALRHVLEDPAMAALTELCVACVDDRYTPERITEVYCNAYNAWLTMLSEGRGGFVREALETIYFSESPAARLLAGGGEAPYSLMSALGHDLDAIGRLVAMEPAMFLLLCERAGMPGGTAARLPLWEPTVGKEQIDPRLSEDWLNRLGARPTIEFFRKHGTGIFARHSVLCYRDGALCGLPSPDPVCLEDLLLYERQRDALAENTRAHLAGQGKNALLIGAEGTGKAALVRAIEGAFAGEGLRLIELSMDAMDRLPELLVRLREQPCKFVLFVENSPLSGDQPDSRLLAGAGDLPANVLLYASARREHLPTDTETVQTDGASPFPLRLFYPAPETEACLTLCRELLERQGTEEPWEDVRAEAEAFLMRRGGPSLRAAWQFAAQAAAQSAHP